MTYTWVTRLHGSSKSEKTEETEVVGDSLNTETPGAVEYMGRTLMMKDRRNVLLFVLLVPLAAYLYVIYRVTLRPCSLAVLTGDDVTSDGELRALPGGRYGDAHHGQQRGILLAQPESRGVSDVKDMSSLPVSVAAVTRPRYVFNCSNLHHIKIKKKIGHGVSKQTYLGEYRGSYVAVKMVTRHLHDVRSCLGKLQAEGRKTSSTQSRCYTLPTMKLMKEILFLEQIDHPNLVRLLGYCVRSEESDSTDITEHGVVAVYEFGSRFVLDNLQLLPWRQRLRHATELTDLLVYLSSCPLGSLVVPDFKEGHFLMVNGSIKLIDLDDVNNVEPLCGFPARPDTGGPGPAVMKTCDYGVRCQQAMCVGFNAKVNLKNMNRLLLKRLLFPVSFPEQIVSTVGQLNAQLDDLALTAEELKARLLSIVQSV